VAASGVRGGGRARDRGNERGALVFRAGRTPHETAGKSRDAGYCGAAGFRAGVGGWAAARRAVAAARVDFAHRFAARFFRSQFEPTTTLPMKSILFALAFAATLPTAALRAQGDPLAGAFFPPDLIGQAREQ